MPGKFSKAILLLAAGSVLFALVCPLAPTPTAVGKVKRLDHAAPLAMGAPVVIALPTSERVDLIVAPDSGRPSREITDLICVRTC